MFQVIDSKTGELANPVEIAVAEEWSTDQLLWCDIEGFAVTEEGDLILLDETGRYTYCPEGRFKVVWDKEEADNGS